MKTKSCNVKKRKKERKKERGKKKEKMQVLKGK